MSMAGLCTHYFSTPAHVTARAALVARVNISGMVSGGIMAPARSGPQRVRFAVCPPWTTIRGSHHDIRRGAKTGSATSFHASIFTHI